MAAERERPDGTVTAQPIVAVVRGDSELNETKLANAVAAPGLRPMTGEEITAIGAVPGYGSPIGTAGATVVADELVAARPTWSPARTRRASPAERQPGP